MKKIFKAFSAGLAAILTALIMTVPCFAELHSDVGDYKDIKLWEMKELVRDSVPFAGYGYVVKNTTVKEETCLVVPEEDTLIVMSGTKLTVKGALHVIGGLYVEKGALIDVRGELCIDGSAVIAGEVRGALRTYKRGQFYCTPSAILKSNSTETEPYRKPEAAAVKPLAAVETKSLNGTLTDKRIITDEEELAALLPDTEDFRTGQYLTPGEETTRTVIFFDNGASLPIYRSGGKVYMIYTVEVRQPRKPGEASGADAEYEYIPDVVSYKKDKSGKIKLTGNKKGSPARYLKKLDKLELIEHAGTWYGNPAANVYDTGDGYILFTAPKSVDKYTSKTVYEAFLYKKKPYTKLK